MSIKASKSCLKYLVNQGINIADIVKLTPTVSLQPMCLTNFKIGKDVACQMDTSRPSSEDWFEGVMDELHLTDALQNVWLTEIIECLGN